MPLTGVKSRPRAALLAVAAATTMLLAFGASAATPENQIVIRGAHSGSSLELRVDGRHLVVEGLMTHAAPRGCHFTRGRIAASCPLRDVGSIVVQMGPSGDRVRVLNKMPAPLTAYLGDGSDKFVGNDEPDTCYSEGARRNRCVGGGNDDICITGNRNSDCVGDGGDDYCRTGAGSDGCWGGPGDDICIMGGGQDGCHGEGGNDRLYGGPSPDRLYGGVGYDHCEGMPGWGRSQNCESGGRR